MAPTVSLALLFLLGLAARVRGCLLCFTSYEERLRVCQFFLGEDSPKLEGCMKAFVSAFKGLRDIEISEEALPAPHLQRDRQRGRGRLAWRWGCCRPDKQVVTGG